MITPGSMTTMDINKNVEDKERKFSESLEGSESITKIDKDDSRKKELLALILEQTRKQQMEKLKEWDMSRLFCSHCNQTGHDFTWCPNRITTRCLYCTQLHLDRKCPQKICHNCFNPCNNPDCSGLTNLKCSQCNKLGHEASECGIIQIKKLPSGSETYPEALCIMCKKNCGFSCVFPKRKNSDKKHIDDIYMDQNPIFELDGIIIDTEDFLAKQALVQHDYYYYSDDNESDY